MVWTTYKERIKRLSQRIVDAQRPIRVLDSIKWDSSIEQALRKSRFKEMPVVGPEYYEELSPLSFDSQKKIEELEDIVTDINNTLGVEDPLAALLVRIAEEYRDVVLMLLARGTPQFWHYSKKLYGSPKDTFYDDKSRILDLGQLMYKILSGIESGEAEKAVTPEFRDELNAEEAVKILNKRFKEYFPDGNVQAKISDGIVADAAAGGDTVKIKAGSLFSIRDIDILEVHEGWVHVGTTQNGNFQHVAKWLSKGPPRCAATQEGLAVIMEIFTFRTYPRLSQF